MRSIDELRELMPIENFMNMSSQYGEDNEYEGWDDNIEMKEHALLQRDMHLTSFFHSLDLEDKEELILLWSKPHLWVEKFHELVGTPAEPDQLDLFEDLEEDHDKETKH